MNGTQAFELLGNEGLWGLTGGMWDWTGEDGHLQIHHLT